MINVKQFLALLLVAIATFVFGYFSTNIGFKHPADFVMIGFLGGLTAGVLMSYFID